jgi:hypothetical protein
MIRIQEQALISCLDPDLNQDQVKFLTQWEPKDLTNWIDRPSALGRFS